MFPKALKSCPKSNKLPNLVSLVVGLQHWGGGSTEDVTVFKMGQSRSLFGLFSFFSHSNSNNKHIISTIKIEKSVDDVLGIQTRGRTVATVLKCDPEDVIFSRNHFQMGKLGIPYLMT